MMDFRHEQGADALQLHAWKCSDTFDAIYNFVDDSQKNIDNYITEFQADTSVDMKLVSIHQIEEQRLAHTAKVLTQSQADS